MTIRDAFQFALNGDPIDGARIQRVHASGGRDARVHSIVLDAYSEFVMALSPKTLKEGRNVLTVTLVEAEPDLFGAIGLVELELILRK